MKLSTRGRYGLRAMCYLAENKDKGYISISEISKELNLSENYLEQLIRLLKKADVVSSSRGPKGGYKIIKDSSDITVGEILRILEGNLTVSECVDHNHICDEKCNAYVAFYKLDKAINDIVDSITLESIINQEI